MTNNKKYHPEDLLREIVKSPIQYLTENDKYNKTIINYLNKSIEKSLIQSDKYHIQKHSGLLIFFYSIGSLFEEKFVYPKNEMFDFNDFETDSEILLTAFKSFYNSYIYNLFQCTYIREELKNIDEFKFYHNNNVVKTYYTLHNKIKSKENDENIINRLNSIKLPAVNIMNNPDLFQKKLSLEENKNLINTSVDQEIYCYILEIELKFINYIKELEENYDYYSMNEKECLYPKNLSQLESEELLDHLSKLDMDNNKIKKIEKFILNRKIDSDSIKIISNLPENPAVYCNIYSIYNLIGRLNSVKVTYDTIDKLKKLYEIHPHFSEVIDYLLISMKLNLRTNKILNFKPILLVGSNGIGKSAFLSDLSSIFNLYNNNLNYGTVTTPAEINGLTSFWSNGNVGFVSKVINTNNVYNPIIIFDEIDKFTSGSHNGNVLAPLYELLEERSSTSFYDNYMGQSINLKFVNYLATANNIKNVDYGIVNRFRVFNIEKPNFNQIESIIKSIYNVKKKDEIFNLVKIDEKGMTAIINSCIVKKINNLRAISKIIDDILMEAAGNNETDEVFIIDYLCDKYLNLNPTLH